MKAKTKRTGMHVTSPLTSALIRRTLVAIWKGHHGGEAHHATSLQIARRTGSMAVHSDVAALRKFPGLNIPAAKSLGLNENGRHVYVYCIQGRIPAALQKILVAA